MPDSNSDFIRPHLMIDHTVLWFTAGIAILSGLLFGLAPAVASVRAGLNSILRQGTRGTSSGASRRLRDGLVIGEIALALLLLVAAGLTLQSSWRVQNVEPGFSSDHLLVLETELPTDSRYRTAVEQAHFHERVLANLERLPGAAAAGMSCGLPMDDTDHRVDFQIEGRPLPPSAPLLAANFRSVSEGYFPALRIPLKQGRLFTSSDTAERPSVAIIDSAAVARYFGGSDPIGHRIKMGRGAMAEIVGVVGSVHDAGLDKEAEPTVYVPFRQYPEARVRYVLRHPNAAGMIGPAKAALYAVDASQPVYNLRMMDEIVAGSRSGSKLMLVLIGVFATVALVLASLGIYGVVSYGVTQRTSEIGIRMALGAGAGEVIRLVMRQGLKLMGAGLLAGIVAAIAVSRLLSSMLFGVQPMDPVILGGTAITLALVATAATFFPARRAARTNPVVSLRYE